MKWLKILIIAYLVIVIPLAGSYYVGIPQLPPRFIYGVMPIAMLPLALFLSVLPMIIIAVIVYKVMERRRKN